MRTTLKELETKLRSRCGELGVELDLEKMMDMWAPGGKRFSATGCHVSCAFQDFDWKVDRRSMLTNFLADLEWGLEDCDDEDCDVCQEEAA